MFKAGLLCLALGLATVGMGWLALSLEAHWQQLRLRQPATGAMVRVLRVLGGLGLLGSLLVCLNADHASMAALVWVMTLAAAALVVAFALAWRPRWLAPLVAWAPRETG